MRYFPFSKIDDGFKSKILNQIINENLSAQVSFLFKLTLLLKISLFDFEEFKQD